MTSHEPSPSTSTTTLEIAPDRRALGEYLSARADAVGHLVDERFADSLFGHAYVTARLGADVIGRWLSTGEAATEEELARFTAQGEQAIVEDASLASVAQAYLYWRDTVLLVLEDARREQGYGAELHQLATAVVRASCDASLVRIVGQFDDTRRTLELRLSDERASMAHRAMHDELTGLANRALLVDRLAHAARSAERRATSSMLLFLDLDSLKTVNDRHGHTTGDALLVAVARRLEEVVRGGDTVARLGGDEFVILATDLEHATKGAQTLADRIHQALQEPIDAGERQLHTSASIGIAPVLPRLDPEICLAQADAAMYEAKRSGPGNTEFYNAVIGRDNERRARLADALRTARLHDEFFVHYQPLFKLGGEMVGMEALLRWTSPTLGQIDPSEFIPLLEQSGEIVHVGRWVIDEAVEQCRHWQIDGRPDLSVSVNVSVRQLNHPDFYDDVLNSLERTGLAPHSLILEISEKVLVMDISVIGDVMAKLHDLGVQLALDNLDTGYTSMLYLRGLPIDRLKVDRGMAADRPSGSAETAVMTSIVDLAHTLGLSVVAEGIESERELATVEALGCDEAQGFHLGRPGPASNY